MSLTPEQYAELRARADRYAAWWNQHAEGRRDASGKLVGASSLSADCQPPDHSKLSNDERAALELYEFVATPPKQYMAYWRACSPRVPVAGDGMDRATAQITTWTGAKLADVIWYGRPYSVPAFGRPSVRQHFRARGINGILYAGIYYKSSGDYVRLRAMKG